MKTMKKLAIRTATIGFVLSLTACAGMSTQDKIRLSALELAQSLVLC